MLSVCALHSCYAFYINRYVYFNKCFVHVYIPVVCVVVFDHWRICPNRAGLYLAVKLSVSGAVFRGIVFWGVLVGSFWDRLRVRHVLLNIYGRTSYHLLYCSLLCLTLHMHRFGCRSEHRLRRKG